MIINAIFFDKINHHEYLANVGDNNFLEISGLSNDTWIAGIRHEKDFIIYLRDGEGRMQVFADVQIAGEAIENHWSNLPPLSDTYKQHEATVYELILVRTLWQFTERADGQWFKRIKYGKWKQPTRWQACAPLPPIMRQGPIKIIVRLPK